MIEAESVAALLRQFDPNGDGEAAKSKELVLALLACSAEPFSGRQFNPGHITCTGLVLSPGRDRILLVLHRRLRGGCFRAATSSRTIRSSGMRDGAKWSRKRVLLCARSRRRC
jgi:hypothetical protein